MIVGAVVMAAPFKYPSLPLLRAEGRPFHYAVVFTDSGDNPNVDRVLGHYGLVRFQCWSLHDRPLSGVH